MAIRHSVQDWRDLDSAYSESQEQVRVLSKELDEAHKEITRLRALLVECLDVVEHEAATFKCDLVARVKAALEGR